VGEDRGPAIPGEAFEVDQDIDGIGMDLLGRLSV